MKQDQLGIEMLPTLVCTESEKGNANSAGRVLPVLNMVERRDRDWIDEIFWHEIAAAQDDEVLRLCRLFAGSTSLAGMSNSNPFIQHI